MVRLGLFEILAVLLSIDLGDDLVLSHVQGCFLNGIFCLLQLRFVFGTSCLMLGLSLGDLLLEVEKFRAPIEGGFDLPLLIEFHEEVALLHQCSRAYQCRHYQGSTTSSTKTTTTANCPAGGNSARQPRSSDRVRLHRFNDSMDPQLAHKVSAFCLGGGDKGCTCVHSVPPTPLPRLPGHEREQNQGEQRTHEFLLSRHV